MAMFVKDRQYYLGTVQITLRNLSYSDIEPDDCTGCCISDLEHNIPALIDPLALHEFLSDSIISEPELYRIGPPPKLRLPESLVLPCLHGKFRLETAKRDNDLAKHDEWWSIDLYNSNTPITALTYIRQRYKKHLPLCDGEKYLHIRFYERQKNKAEAMRWRELIGASKIKKLNQIMRNEWLCEVLENLELYRSLWMNFQLGSFSQILSWRCSQEVEYYLNQMLSTWCKIAGENGHFCDEYTIQKLQGLTPRWSSRDRSKIESLFAAKEIFPRVSDPATRSQLLERVISIDGIILTFETFFKHVKTLEPIMMRLRELFPPYELFPTRETFDPLQRRYPSVQEILLRKCFKPSNSNQCLLQYSEYKAGYIESSNSAMYSYWQLCLYLLRQQQELRYSPKKTRSESQLGNSPAWLIRLSHFAQRLGFESDRILELNQQDPELSSIRSHMLEERPTPLFFAPPDAIDTEAISRQKGLAIFEPRQFTFTPLMTCDGNTQNRVIRCHPGLFLPNIWNALKQDARYCLTEYGTLVLVLVSFFEKFEPSYTNYQDYQATESARHPSSVYSPPPSGHYAANNSVHLPIAAQPSVRNQGEDSPLNSSHVSREQHSIVFWHLPNSRELELERRYACDATAMSTQNVIDKIIAEGISPLFLLKDNNNRLMLCDSSQIFQRRRQLRCPNAIYYIYGNENSQIWVAKPLSLVTSTPA